MRLARKILSAVLMISMVLVNMVVPVGFAVADTNSNENIVNINSASNEYVATDITFAPGADSTKLNFNWYSNLDSPNSVVQVAKKADMTGAEFPTEKATVFNGTVSSAVTGFYSNKVTVTDLQESTQYVYRVGDGNDTNWSPVYNYTTQDPDNYSFLAVGDPQIGSSGSDAADTNGWKDTMSKAFSQYPDVSFLLSLGDQIESNSNENEYNGFFAPPELRSLPVAPLVGNHDNGAPNYNYHFNLPNLSSQYGKTTNSSSDYYFTYGQSLFMVLNTNNTNAAEHEAFIDETIAANSNATWKVVMFHQDIYGSGGHAFETGIQDLKRKLFPIFDQHDIDLVLTGHDHSYTRTYQMFNDQPLKGQNSIGTLYMTLNSGSGSKYYDLQSLPETYAAVRDQLKKPTFSKFDVTANTLTVSTYRTDTMVMTDTYTIAKEAQESLDLAGVTAAADGSTLDAANSSASIALSVTAKDSTGATVDLNGVYVLYKTADPDILSVATDGKITVKNAPVMDKTVKVWAEVYNGTGFVKSNELDVNVTVPLGLAEVTLVANGTSISSESTTGLKLSLTGKDTTGADMSLSSATVEYHTDKTDILAIAADGTVTVQNAPERNTNVEITADVTVNGKKVTSNALSITVTIGAGTEIIVPVIDALDDIEERANGTLDFDSSDLEIVQEKPNDAANQLIGLRFVNLAIPKGATITDAYIQFSVDEPNKDIDPFKVQIHAEDVVNSDPFIEDGQDPALATYVVSDKYVNKTTESVEWKDAPSWTTEHEADTAEQTPNLASLVQNIVGKADWSSGNAMTFFLSGEGRRIAESFDGSGSDSEKPTLHVNYVKVDSSIPISQARNLATGTQTTVIGIVTCVNPTSTGSYFIQDGTAGINIYNPSLSPAPQQGDKIRVTGPTAVYKGLLEIMPTSSANVSILSSGNTLPDPAVITLDQIGNYQSQLVKVSNITLGIINNGGNTPITDDAGHSSILYKMPAIGGISAGDMVDITGIVTAYNVSELIVRNAADIVKSSGPVDPNASTVEILATSDLHGNIYPYDYFTGATVNQGLAKVSTYVNQERLSNPNLMLIDNGDTIQGTPLATYYATVDKTSPNPMLKAMAAMHYDTWTLGNHEFNFGLDMLDKVTTEAEDGGIHVLSANTYKGDGDNNNLVEPYYIKTVHTDNGDIKVGILGLTTKCIPSWEGPANYQDLHFNDLVSEANKWVPIMKTAGADIVVAAIHSGEEGSSDVIPENQIKAVAQGVNGIDAIVAGHTHAVIPQHDYTSPDGEKVIVTEPGKWGQYVSKLQFSVKLDNGKWSVVNQSAQAVPMDSSIAPDSSITTLAQLNQDATLAYLGTKIGTATGVYSGADQLTAETAIMDLINKVQQQESSAQLSIAAPLSSSALIPQGDVTIKDISSVYIYENFLYSINMTGAQLKKWLEYSARYYKQVSGPSDPITKDTTLNIADYNLDQLYGANYTIDLTQPAGSRIKDLTYNGNAVQDADVFSVAINNYRYNGGGGFMAAAGLTPGEGAIYDSMKTLGDAGQVRNLLIKYVQDQQTITPTVANNWSISRELSSGDKIFDIIAITDLHGNIGNTTNSQIGAVLAENIKNNVYANNPDRTLILANGDNYQGTAISNLQYGEPVMEIFNYIGVAASALGNHEFDWGLDKVTDITHPVKAEYPILCANLFPKGNTTDPVFDPYKIFTLDGVKVAVVGGITESTPNIVAAGTIENYDVLSNVTYINKYAQEARAAGAQMVIALIHEGDDYSNGASGPIVDIAKNLVGIDAVFGGHTHDIVNTTVTTNSGKNIPLAIGNSNGKGYIDLKAIVHEDGSITFTNANSSYVAQDTTSTVYPYGYKATTPTVDQTVKQIIVDTMAEEGPTLEEVLGSAQKNLDRNQIVSPYGESLAGNWATNVMRSESNADFAFQNNGGLRCDIPQGQITMAKIYEFMPFDNVIMTCDMTGAQLKVILEEAVADGGKGIQLSGLNFLYDSSKPSGSRVYSIIKSDGTPVNLNDTTTTYKVATNDFMAGGTTAVPKDGFSFASQSSNMTDTHILVRDALADAVRDAGAAGITASIENRMKNQPATADGPDYMSVAINNAKIVTITFSENLVSNVGDLKEAVSFAADGTNYQPLGSNDTVVIKGSSLEITFANELAGTANRIKIAANALKNETGNVQTEEIVTESFNATIDECFIATASFGSKFEPSVVLLRNFRDKFLLTNPVGAAFVNFYYHNSPPIAQFIAGNEALKIVVRILLTPFVVLVYFLFNPLLLALSLILLGMAVMWIRKRKALAIQ